MKDTIRYRKENRLVDQEYESPPIMRNGKVITKIEGKRVPIKIDDVVGWTLHGRPVLPGNK